MDSDCNLRPPEFLGSLSTVFLERSHVMAKTLANEVHGSLKFSFAERRRQAASSGPQLKNNKKSRAIEVAKRGSGFR